MASDNEIVSRVYSAKGNSVLADSLIEDYLPFIKSETSKFTGRMVKEGVDDEVSIAMIAFHQAVEAYSKTKGAFLSFAAVVIKNRLIDFTRSESRHTGQVSLDQQSNRHDGISLMDSIEDESDDFYNSDCKGATFQEIKELQSELEGFGLSLTDIADNSPRQERTLDACRDVVDFCLNAPNVVSEVKSTGRLPVARIVEETKVARKTLERHRKYILAMLVIYSNGYEIIRNHLNEVFIVTKGGSDQ